ncbi:thioredoxin fold domain-containing protein [Sulfurospirillum sp. T05]|uniref:Thioredoxin fold domain-containing protein n=1 Tax=Sulfurospirillum tamanense TaxID=2813362 RepID=A0ABS2WT67_9BACT|nr:thioredoxin fold domain-containing protein [Sulfurospirillum tamanensis]MBN2964821.1 thioredoxin fold domain-containing protein [Sulfurospirillum tamanensis]
MRWFVGVMCVVCFGFAGLFEQAIEEAKKEEKLVWVFVEIPRCPWCARMRHELLESGVYDEALSGLYVVVPLGREEAIAKGLRAEYFPTSFLIDPTNGETLEMLPGYMKSEDFIEYLKLVYEIEQGDK